MKALRAIPLLLVLFVVPTVVAAESGDQDTWYAVYVGEAKVGWTHETVRRVEEDGVTFRIQETESQVSLARMGQTISIVQSQTTKERPDGTVVEFRSSMSMGAGEQTTAGRLDEEGRLHVNQMGTETVVDYPAGAIGPLAMLDLLRKEGLTPGTVVKTTTFSPDLPATSVTTEMTVGAAVKKDVLGRVVEVFPVRTTNSAIPIVVTLYLTADFELLASETPIPGMGTFAAYRTAEKIAKADVSAAEVFTTSFVRPDRAIPKPRKLTRAVYRLTLSGEGANLLQDARQKVASRQMVLEISADPAPAGFRPFALPVKDEAYASFLAPNAYVESDDSEVVKLAEEAVGDETDAAAAAKKIERFVAERIVTKSMNVGFATAAEVARTLEGDCTEHAVLCCALARAKGLPARVVVGLVYLPPDERAPITGKTGVFGYHMWTEVLVGPDRWMPIDAAIGAWDATHIALGKSDLSDLNPVVDLTIPTLETMGRLKIEVLE